MNVPFLIDCSLADESVRKFILLCRGNDAAPMFAMLAYDEVKPPIPERPKALTASNFSCIVEGAVARCLGSIDLLSKYDEHNTACPLFSALFEMGFNWLSLLDGNLVFWLGPLVLPKYEYNVT